MKYKWLPVVDTAMCTGCQMCIEACTPRCLEIVENVAVLTKPDICSSEEHCIAPCPIGVISMEWVEMAGNQKVGLWKSE